ncbi:hypothetical protein ATCC90586_011294 [Pythium insidiosum]|nr:hypothetical protein ATCC90586_011294 [Pythium insidiosum]
MKGSTRRAVSFRADPPAVAVDSAGERETEGGSRSSFRGARQQSKGSGLTSSPDSSNSDGHGNVGAKRVGASAERKERSTRGVDAGTDPLDSFAPGQRSAPQRSTLVTPRTSRGTDPRDDAKRLVPPAAPVVVATPSKQRVDSTTHTNNSPGDDVAGLDHPARPTGELLEKEMKELLTRYANDPAMEPADDDRERSNQSSPEDEGAMASPRFVSNKVAEQRQPPNPRSRQGYRAFRLPSRGRATATP